MTTQTDSQYRCPPHLDTVLIGCSLEQESEPVVSAGAAVARATGAKIHLVHVAPPELFAVGFEAAWLPAGALREETERRRGQLREKAGRLGIDPGQLAGLEVALGTPHRMIIETARRIGAKLIVVGASEPGGRLGKLLGSTADRVVRQADCPVLVVRGELPVPPLRVLMPVDLSELSADAFRCGLHFLGEISKGAPAEIEAFYALDYLAQLKFLGSDMPWMTTSQQVESHAQRELEQFIRESCDQAPPPAPVHIQMRPGDARVEILSEVDRTSADLVILGTHGRSGFDRLLLGSIASAVLRQASCSVLLIPPTASLDQAIAEAVVNETAPAWHIEHGVVQTRE